MAEKERIRLNLDSLFPGDEHTIAGQSIPIKPLSLSQIASLTQHTKTLVSSLKEQGVTWDEIGTPENIFKVATTIVHEVPEILEEASNIHLDDIKALDINETIKLAHKIVDVNFKSKDDLMGNLNSLIEKILPEMEEATIPSK